MSQVKRHDIIKQPERSNALNVGANLWHVWQVKGLLKRIEAVEEKLKSLVDVVDDLKDFKKSILGRLMFEEGERKTIQVKRDDILKQPEPTNSVNVGANLCQVLQVKGLFNRTDAVEEVLNSLVDLVVDLKDFKKSVVGRPMFEEGEKFQSGLAGGALGRDEFEEIIEELGEAITRIAIKQRRQDEEFVSTTEDILKEINDKISIEDHEECRESIRRKLKILEITIENIRKMTNDVLYPAACGTTKCVVEEQASAISTPSAGDVRPRLKRERNSFPDLRFTHSSYAEEEKRLKLQEGIQEHGVRGRQMERSEDRRAISIPAIRPQQAPVSVSIFGNEESQIYIKRSGNKRKSTDSNF